jgi:hypothetical protein
VRLLLATGFATIACAVSFARHGREYRQHTDILKSIEQNAIDVGIVTLPSPVRMFDVKPGIVDEFVVVSATNRAKLPRRATPSDFARRPVAQEEGAHTR